MGETAVNVGAGAVLTLNTNAQFTAQGASPQVTVNGAMNIGDPTSTASTKTPLSSAVM